jgi:hypothetical protein
MGPAKKAGRRFGPVEPLRCRRLPRAHSVHHAADQPGHALRRFVAAVASVATGFLAWHAVADVRVPGWAISAGLATVLLLFLLFATSLGFAFTILAGRGSAGFLPFREFAHYVSHTSSLPVIRLNVDHDVRRN